MLILQILKDATRAEHFVKSGAWERGEPRTGMPTDVRDVTVGIIGLGNIGKLVQKKVEALGMKVIYHNRHRLPPEGEAY
jgi:lactate dehydrogenase-like 2-hydroxyacid dehydrogenase